jgi:hypothetical protein
LSAAMVVKGAFSSHAGNIWRRRQPTDDNPWRDMGERLLAAISAAMRDRCASAKKNRHRAISMRTACFAVIIVPSVGSPQSEGAHAGHSRMARIDSSAQRHVGRVPARGACGSLCHERPPLTIRNRISAAGRSGGRRGGMSVNRAPHVPRGSSCHGQSADNRTKRSSSKISAPYFTASRASRYEPARLHASQRSRTST